MQRDRNDYLAGYRTRTVKDLRTAWNSYGVTTYYHVPVTKNIPCPSKEDIEFLHKWAILYRLAAWFTVLVLVVGGFIVLGD